jgi:rubrerythrin
MPKPIKTFLLNVVLERAIKIEEDTYSYYGEQLSRAADEGVRALLKSFMEEALDHRMRLEDMQKEGNLVCIDLYREDYEPEKPGESGRKTAKEAEEADRKILEAALEREKETRDYYQWVEAKTKLDLVRDAFSCFVHEEEERIKKIREVLHARSTI